MTSFIPSTYFGPLQWAPSNRSASRNEASLQTEEIITASRLDHEALLASLQTSRNGLDRAEAERRSLSAGPNAIAQEGIPSVFEELWSRAKSPLNALLLCLAATSYLLGDLHSAIVITVIVTLAIGMAFLQEHRSTEAATKLRRAVKTMASVKRRDTESQDAGHPNGFQEIPLEDVVPGDIVRLSAGDIIPADLRLLETKDLFVDQAALTGESIPVEKSAQVDVAAEGNPLSVSNVCLMGGSVVSGFATAVVVNTGPKTYFGQLASRVVSKRQLTSFERGVNRFIRLMLYFMLALAPAVFLINGLTKGDWAEALLFGLAIAVGLTPELLPMIVTVNLAKGAVAMAEKRVIVKRLNAIQNFGAMDVLCTDKTGTLTQNRVSLSLYLDIDGKTDERVLEYAFLNSQYQSGLKSLLDAAVLEHIELGKNLHLRHDYQVVDEIPFDFSRKRLSVALSRGQGEGSANGVARFF